MVKNSFIWKLEIC